MCAFWDSLGRQRIENYILALAEYFRRRLAKTFGEPALLQPLYDPDLKSGIIAYNPFPRPDQRRSAQMGADFRDRFFKQYRYHSGGEGLGPTALTRLPDPEAAAFPAGSIPNRDPVTNAPAPTDYPVRANACLWNNRSQIDQYVSACEELVQQMTA